MNPFVKKTAIIGIRVFMLPVLLVLLILRPWLRVRVSGLNSNRIGHFAMNNELYLCEKDAGLLPLRTFDVFFHDTPICNHQMKRMWDARLRVAPWAYFVNKAVEYYPGFQQHRINTSSRDRYGIYDRCRPHLSFTETELSAGKSALFRMGVGENPFVCLLCRDSGYLKKHYPVRDWSYHDYRDVDVETYLPALRSLGDRGYFVLRMGAVVEGPLKTHHPKIIDYASNGFRSEFLDIYLPSQCCFFISNGAGLDAVAKLFHRPVLYVNQIPLGHIHTECANDLFIFKKIWLCNEKRFMKFSEILKSGVGRFLDGRLYQKHGLEVINNTPEEIEAVTLEMVQRLEGSWKATEEEEDIQDRFWALFKPDDMNQVFLSRVGAAFLQENVDLL